MKLQLSSWKFQCEVSRLRKVVGAKKHDYEKRIYNLLIPAFLLLAGHYLQPILTCMININFAKSLALRYSYNNIN
jgi:hypothetical protein